MERTANYYIFQHLPDLFRRECQNVGVLVKIGEATRARFFGESDQGSIDRRKIRSFAHPSVYTQWISFWRRTLKKMPDEAIAKIVRTTSGNYQVVDAGVITDIGNDSIDDVLNYLYAILISEGGFAEAFGGPDEHQAIVKLKYEVANELLAAQVLAEDASQLMPQSIRYPVKAEQQIQGKVALHQISFAQRNGHLTVMEPVDLTVTRERSRLRERAGFAAYIFSDVKKAEDTSESIAIVRATASDEQEENGAYAIRLLQDSASRVVNWLSESDRVAFIQERIAIATSTDAIDL